MSQATFKGVVKLSQTQYETLKSEGTISIGDVTLTYDPTTTLYVTPSTSGSGTNVTVGGTVQETWSADTKVDASSSQTQEQNTYTETVQNTNGTLNIQSTNNDGKVFTDITSNSGGIKLTQNVYHDDWATPNNPAIIQAMEFNSGYGLQLTALDNRSNSGSGLVVGAGGDGLQLVSMDSHITLASDEIHIADSSASNDFVTITSDQMKFDKKSGTTMEGTQVIDGKSITLSQFLTESETSTSNVSLRLAVKGSDTSDTVSNFSISTKDDTVTHTLEFKNGQLLVDGSELGGGTGSGLATESSSSDGSKNVTLTNSNGEYSFIKTNTSGYTFGVWTSIPDTVGGTGGMFAIGQYSSTSDQTIKFSDGYGLQLNYIDSNSGDMKGSAIALGSGSDGVQIIGVGGTPFIFQTDSEISLEGTALTYNSKNLVTEDSLPTSVDISGGSV